MTERAKLLQIKSPGTEVTRFNALRHGVLSRYTVLPWEDADEYHALVAALAAEHAPQGPTEEHLVEELAGILWRKRRLRLAEAATYRRGLKRRSSPSGDRERRSCISTPPFGPTALKRPSARPRATPRPTSRDAGDEAMTRRALDLLGSRRNDAYEAALAALREDTRDWWQDMLACDADEMEEDEEPVTADGEGLRRFIEGEVLPRFETRKKELANRPLIREQAFGEALDPDKLERLGRYEVHLDRKLERTLAMLLKLKELRAAPVEV